MNDDILRGIINMQFHVYDKKYTIQFIKFISVSGIGFLIDFAVYYYLTTYIGFPIAYGNMVSAIPAITWVFVFSTNKILLEFFLSSTTKNY